MSLPDVTVIIPTFNRTKILVENVANIMLNLRGCNKKVLIGDDGSNVRDTINTLLDYNFPVGKGKPIEVFTGPHRGLGANLNMLIERAETEVIMQLDDDHILAKLLDVGQYVNDLIANEWRIGWIRLMLGEESDVANPETYYHFEAMNWGRYWYLKADGRELYLASNRPHLKRKDFHTKYYGFYELGMTLGEVEESFCHQYKNVWKRDSGNKSIALPSVVIPVVAPPFGTWKHVGDSWQKKGF